MKKTGFPLRVLLFGFLVVTVCPGFVWLFLTSSTVAGTQTLVDASALPWAQTSWGSAAYSNLHLEFVGCSIQEARLASFQNGTSLALTDNFTGFEFCLCDLLKGILNAYSLHQMFLHIWIWKNTSKGLCSAHSIVTESWLGCYMQVLHNVIFRCYNKCYRCYMHSVNL